MKLKGKVQYTKKITYSNSGPGGIARRLLIPKEVTEDMGLVKGDEVLLEYDSKKKIIIVKRKSADAE